ncbi:hypothetical protein [Aeromonas allosaccharophila]|uniref:hypothetical protein n=1 Tax=Aeromonas allosaccharophila TaxID=656 RepID=UPI000A7DC7FF|nr:hypothetical protein [Aeromonas allosaccharophila]
MSDVHLRHGLNVMNGKLTCKEVAVAHGLAHTDALTLLICAGLRQSTMSENPPA